MTRQRRSRAYTGTDITNKIEEMLPCLQKGEQIAQCIISVGIGSNILVCPEGDIIRTDCKRGTKIIYKLGERPEVRDVSNELPTRDDVARFCERLCEDMCDHFDAQNAMIKTVEKALNDVQRRTK